MRIAYASAMFILVAPVSGCIQPKHFGSQDSGTVGARIIDATERTPIAAATVTEFNTHRSVVSAPDGAFGMTLTVGPHHLVVQASGYADFSFDIIIEARKLKLATSDGYIRLVQLK